MCFSCSLFHNEAGYLLKMIMEIEEGVIRRGRRPRRITPSEISIILHMIGKTEFSNYFIIPSK